MLSAVFRQRWVCRHKFYVIIACKLAGFKVDGVRFVVHYMNLFVFTVNCYVGNLCSLAIAALIEVGDIIMIAAVLVYAQKVN